MPKNIKIYTIFKNTDREFTGTIEEISEHFSINKNTLNYRLKKVNTLEEAIDFKNKKYLIHINESNIMNCGMKCTIIEYFGNKNITVKFKDGTIVKNRAYGDFKKGEIKNLNLSNKNKSIGETRMMNCGMKCTIIEYFGNKNITVKFEDGTIIKNKYYQCFKKGNIANFNLKINYSERLYETRMMNCGMNATIIEYVNKKNITVQFEDGTIVKNRAYYSFKNSQIANHNLNGKNARLYETRMMNCGMKCTIIEYFSVKNITVKFEDGTIVKNRAYYSFKKSRIMNPNLNYFIIYEGTDKEFVGTLRQISDHFNLNYGNLNNKINIRNMTIEEAIEMPLCRVKQNNLIYKGKKGTMRELCKKFDKNFVEVYNKVKYNHTFDWAMDSTITPYDLNNNDDYNCNDN